VGHRRRNAGFTIVEIVIAVLIIVMMSGVVVRVSDSGSGAYRTGVTVADLDARTARALERIVREISAASAATLDPPDPAGGDRIAFQLPVGEQGTAVVWSDPVRYAVELAPGEILNGADDNGDGLVDDGVLVRIENPGLDERRIILARGVARLLAGELPNGVDDNGNGLVDEGGFSLTVEQGAGRTAMRLRLTLQGIDPASGLMERTLESSVVLRN
jgi:type II secretory pathway pseudopilin PulG